ncbi:alpha-E domain-containing protein [Qipengyuania sp. 1NDW9]|uniref:alpha-E domain-containing protein n=1 Tax=Qipengyuania TaxID=1855416 RepID=UPI001C86A4FB|nr:MULTISPECIES: alpha-E domain-containing protein [Qipengyuania]MBX7493654.1 alpha-E domain-containing protein [Qipengyuania xiapuensis]UOR14321.1 alpha-E domain-containing protein [Qipengyuania aquimaris]
MLGRTANGLFWMFRYLERAENTARLLDAGLRMALTRDLVTAEEEWRSVIETSGQRAAYEQKHSSYTGHQAWNFMLREKANPASIICMYKLVRQNARLARNAISGELWEAINENWLIIDDQLAKPVGENHVLDAVKTIRRAATMARGALTGSMLREEGYHFAQSGMFIERADSIARILDIKYYLLLPSLSYVGSSLDTGQWDTVLRSVSGDRAYRWLNAGRIDARGICEFLILDDRFPRSLAFCHSELRNNLAALARLHGTEGESNALMRDADTRIADLSIDEIFDQGLHEFLTEFMASNAAIGEAIARDYRFLS